MNRLPTTLDRLSARLVPWTAALLLTLPVAAAVPPSRDTLPASPGAAVPGAPDVDPSIVEAVSLRRGAFALGPPPGLSASPASATLRLEGVPAAVVSADPIDAWRITLWFDAPLTSADGLSAAAGLLADRAEALTALGPVEIVLADPFDELFLEPTRDAGRLRSALEVLPGEAVSASEVEFLRADWADYGGGADEAAEVAAEEAELVAGLQEQILSRIAASSEAGPRLLVLVRDGLDLDPWSHYGASTTQAPRDAPAAAVLAARHGEIARLLPSAGWTVVTLAAGRTLGHHELPREPLEAWTTASAGALTLDALGVDRALASLRGRWWVVFEAPLPADGTPRSLEVVEPAGAVAPNWVAADTPTALAAARARAVLERPREITGALPLGAALRVEGDPFSGNVLTGELEVLLEGEGVARVGVRPWFRLTVYSRSLEGRFQVEHYTVRADDLSRAGGWLYRRPVELPPDLSEAVVVLEDLETGLWGSALAALTDLPAAAAPRPVVVQEHDPAPAAADPAASSPAGAGTTGAGTAGAPAAPPAQAPVAKDAPPPIRQNILRLLPPRRQPATGRTRFQTLVVSTAVDRVDFLLDGDKLDSDTRAPFNGILDLGPEAVPREVTAVAYTSDGAELARDTVVVNPDTRPFSVFIQDVQPVAPGRARVVADVSVPPGERLDRVEVAFGEEPGVVLRTPPWEAEVDVPAQPGPADYVRVVAVLADGSQLEDVRLLAALGPVERLDVNLVELHVVVTERDGTPIEDLGEEEFTVLQDGQERPIERFALAQDVPLTLGVVIDTSGSMWTLMPDTQKAASSFVGNTLRPGDQAFVVDFDAKPRLLQGITGDILPLMRAIGRLRPDGTTALYDAVVFSMLQFEQVGGGRRALVVLSDGDDVDSHFGPRRCIEFGRKLGVPIYSLGLAGIEDPRRGRRKIDLEGISEATGGRVFYINQIEQLPEAYAQIQRELRSQYILAFATDRRLEPDEIDDLEVKVGRRGVEVRTVIGGQDGG